jgi:hypothetical protein
MIRQDHIRALNELHLLKDEINNKSNDISNNEITAFSPITIRKPELSIAIHGFYTTISWLYIAYYEAGKTSIDFLTEFADSLGILSRSDIQKHLFLIHSFRTYLQHNMNSLSKEDNAKISCCQHWIQISLESAGTDIDSTWPESEKQWEVLISKLLVEATKFMKSLHSTIIAISSDEFSKDIVNTWISRSRRAHSPFEYDRIIELAASDMGFISIDPIILRKRFYEKWEKKIKLFRDGFNFELEARKMVEQTLLNEENLPLPISGADIMSELGIAAGPDLRKVMKMALRYYCEMPCSKKELMKRLRDTIESVSQG